MLSLHQKKVLLYKKFFFLFVIYSLNSFIWIHLSGSTSFVTSYLLQFVMYDWHCKAQRQPSIQIIKNSLMITLLTAKTKLLTLSLVDVYQRCKNDSLCVQTNWKNSVMCVCISLDVIDRNVLDKYGSMSVRISTKKTDYRNESLLTHKQEKGSWTKKDGEKKNIFCTKRNNENHLSALVLM